MNEFRLIVRTNGDLPRLTELAQLREFPPEKLQSLIEDWLGRSSSLYLQSMSCSREHTSCTDEIVLRRVEKL